MKAERVKTPETTEVVSLPPREKGRWIKKWRQNTLLCRKKTEADWQMDLQTYEAGRK
jgi:hypothetical protein